MTEQSSEQNDWVMPDADQYDELDETAEHEEGEHGGDYHEEPQDDGSPAPEDES